MREEEADKNDFVQYHNDISKEVEKVMKEIIIPAMRARRLIPLCYIGMLFGAFLMFLACV